MAIIVITGFLKKEWIGLKSLLYQLRSVNESNAGKGWLRHAFGKVTYWKSVTLLEDKT